MLEKVKENLFRCSVKKRKKTSTDLHRLVMVKVGLGLGMIYFAKYSFELQ